MFRAILLVAPFLVVLSGCAFEGPDEKNIRLMVESYLSAVDQNDRDIAYACLMDTRAFNVLYPDASARVDGEGYAESVVADLIHEHQKLVSHFDGRSLKVKKFRLGTPWYQYKPHSAFRDNDVTVSVDGEDITFYINGIVRIDNRWRIVDLSGIELY